MYTGLTDTGSGCGSCRKIWQKFEKSKKCHYLFQNINILKNKWNICVEKGFLNINIKQRNMSSRHNEPSYVIRTQGK